MPVFPESAGGTDAIYSCIYSENYGGKGHHIFCPKNLTWPAEEYDRKNGMYHYRRPEDNPDITMVFV